MKTLYTTLLTALSVICFSSSNIAMGQGETPAADQKNAPIAIVGGTVHTVSGKTIENGIVIFDNGKITQVGKGIKVPKRMEKIDATGKHVYPGLFESHSQLGLSEIGAVGASLDFAETGSINPNVKAHVAVNPDSALIPVTRANGILLALTSPSGGLISGQAAVLQMDGWTFEDVTLKSSVAMKVNWPSVTISPRRRARMSPEEIGKAIKEQRKRIDDLQTLFDDARAYGIARKENLDQQSLDLRLEAMLPLLEGEQKMLVAANGLAEIESAVAFAVKQNVKLIILGGYDAPRCADLLKQHDVPVILSAVYRLPRRRSDPFDQSYNLPQQLKQAGVTFCISGSDRSETWNVRLLPDHAATAIAYGLSEPSALRAITLTPAEVFGVADRVGSIEAGKDATLFVANGNIFEIKTNVTHAFIQGKPCLLYTSPSPRD